MEWAMTNSRTAWAFFAAALLLAIFYVTQTSPQLPPFVASHFDAAGVPNAFMAHNTHVRFMLTMCVGLPLSLVAIMSAVYSYANNIKIPNRDYWLAPERSAATRSLLIARGLWFGVLLAFFAVTAGWILALLVAFRRP
jgi:uncharacterized membrane protein